MKIDVSKIKGYEEMTPEEKIAALEAFDVEEDHTGYVKKETFDKTASELAGYKKQLKAKMTEDELKEKETNEQFEELKANYEELLKQTRLSDTKAKYLALGYEEKLAQATAEAILSGDMDTVFANQKKHLEAQEKKIKSDLLKDTPKPDGGTSSSAITAEKFASMNYFERAELFEKDRELYDKLSESESEGDI